MGHRAPNMKAAGAIGASRFVKITADRTVDVADANAQCIGITHRNSRRFDDADVAEANEAVPLAGPGDEVELIAGTGGFTAGDRLKSDASGGGVPIAGTGTTIQEIGAIALEDAAAGERGRVIVWIYSERPALV